MRQPIRWRRQGCPARRVFARRTRAQAPSAYSCRLFDLQQLLDPVAPVLAPVPRLLVAAERGQRVEGAAVDLDLAGADPLGDRDRPLLVGRPDAAGEAVGGCRWRSAPRRPRRRRAGSPAPGRRSPPGRSSSPASPRRRRWGGRSSRLSRPSGASAPPVTQLRALRPRPSRCSRARAGAGLGDERAEPGRVLEGVARGEASAVCGGDLPRPRPASRAGPASGSGRCRSGPS